MKKILLIFFTFSLFHLLTFAETGQTVNIWEGMDVSMNVEMTPYLVPGTENKAQNGISAFVLRYRTAYVPAFITRFRFLFRGNRYPDPQDDLRQALTYVRKHAKEYGVDAHRVGAMGFSAGGHLVMSAAEWFRPQERPDFVVPVYPVVTMTKNCVHKRSRRALLGESKVKDARLRDSLSLEQHVPADCPPVFLVNCKDDPVVDYRNSVLLDSALQARHIPHVYLQYQTGGHGFGASEKKGSPECRQWKQAFLAWVREL